MSNNSYNKNDQPESQVLVTPEECHAALEFWKHFKIPIPQSLADAVERFTNNPTLENQDILKLEICKSIAETDHEAFKVPMFEQIVQECANTAYNMQFDKDIEKVLSEE
jgi:Lhr-like helicase